MVRHEAKLAARRRREGDRLRYEISDVGKVWIGNQNLLSHTISFRQTFYVDMTEKRALLCGIAGNDGIGARRLAQKSEYPRCDVDGINKEKE